MNRRMPPTTNRQLAVRLAVSRALGRTRDLDDVYNAALATLAECLNVSRASVLLFDADGVMRFKAYRGLSSEYRAAVEGHSPWTSDSVEAEPILVPDVSREPTLQQYLPAFVRERIVALTPYAMQRLPDLERCWAATEAASDSLDDDVGQPLAIRNGPASEELRAFAVQPFACQALDCLLEILRHRARQCRIDSTPD